MTEAFQAVCDACSDRDFSPCYLEAGAEADAALHNSLVHDGDTVATVEEVTAAV